MKFLFSTLLFLIFSVNMAFGQTSGNKDRVIKTLETFQQAIVNNKSEAASKLLAKGTRILEGGNIETKEEYLSHHFHSDGKFLSAMKRDIVSQTVNIENDVAWVTTKSHLWGAYGERELNLNSLELAVLKKVDNLWKITALHWSSSARD